VYILSGPLWYTLTEKKNDPKHVFRTTFDGNYHYIRFVQLAF
jgi:hypothetical protein